jgi:hypothetical protein
MNTENDIQKSGILKSLPYQAKNRCELVAVKPYYQFPVDEGGGCGLHTEILELISC